MRNPGGVLICTSPEGTQETDTFTCNHCNGIVVVQTKQRPEDTGGLCKVCMKLICPRCVAKGSCEPFEVKLKRQEARGQALRSYGFDG